MVSRREVAALLAEVPLFSLCTKRALGTIARHVDTVDVAAGKTIVREGAPGDAFFVVLSGEAEVLVGGVPAGTLARGSQFGELALLSPAPRAATVRALNDMTLAVLGARMFRTLVREYPDLSEKLLAALAEELRAARAAARDVRAD